jgi:hypothetical protein
MITRFFEEMPHAVQGTIRNDSGCVWFTMNPSRMSPSPEELALEHGEVMQGVWNVVGVVDTVPGAPVDAPPAEGLSAATRGAMEMVRSQFGRPDTAYGLTPLMVFRALKTKP